MPLEYRVFVHMDCLEVLPKYGQRREAVVQFIRNLGSAAHLGGEFQMIDPETFRRFEVTHVAGFAVTWWIDGPVNEVKVVDVRSSAG
jgi:hypothetical protein